MKAIRLPSAGRQPTRSRFGPFLIDVQERVLEREGQPVPLTPKAFDLLAALVEQPGRLVSKDELLTRVWPDTFVEESNLAYHVFALRKALGDTSDGQFIETVPKRGYRFKAALTPVSDGEHESAGDDGEGRDPGDASSAAPKAGPSARWAWIAVPVALLAILLVAARSTREPREPDPVRALPLTSLRGVVRAPSLSPDGSYVVFTWTGPDQDNPDLYVQQIGTGRPLRLTTHPATDYSPSWSPDGRAIAFLRRVPDTQRSEVRLIAPLGGAERKLADVEPRLPLYRPLAISWCPDSRCVVTTDSPGAGNADAVFAIAVDGGTKRQLTHPAGPTGDGDPSISPDGRLLIFRRDTTPFSGAIHRLRLKADGSPDGDAVRVTPTLSAGKPAWMPDSREVVFPVRGALWRLDVLRGGEPTRLPFVGQDGSSPVVSKTADGRLRLVYVRSFSDGNVWRIETPAAGVPAILPAVAAVASTRSDLIPNLSPDGGRLAFLSDRSGEWHIWVAETDGAAARPLTTTEFTSGPGFPRWSPDGTTIAFHGDPAGRPDVVVVPAGGGAARVLTAHLPNGGFPSFSRDGRWIYFTVNQAGEARVWKIPARGGTAVQVTQNDGTLAIESHDGRDLYYVAAVERSSPLWRLPLGGGTAARVLDGVVLGNFDVVEGGLYYIDGVPGAGGVATDRTRQQMRLRYLDFATGLSTTIAHDLGTVGFGLSASRDGRRVFYSRVDSSVDELMLVDDFR